MSVRLILGPDAATMPGRQNKDACDPQGEVEEARVCFEHAAALQDSSAPGGSGGSAVAAPADQDDWESGIDTGLLCLVPASVGLLRC